MTLTSQVDYQEGQIAKKLLTTYNDSVILLMAFDKGMKLDTHAAPSVAMVQVLEGTCHFTYVGEERVMKKGDFILMEPGALHSLRAEERFKVMLVKL